MNKPQNQAIADFIAMTRQSWTYQRLTEQEKAACGQALTSAPAQDISGTYKQRWCAYNAVYHAFLLGLGYTGVAWREPAETGPLPFTVGVEV